MNALFDLKPIDSESLKKLLQLVYHHTGISMGDDKTELLASRLRGRLRELSFSDYSYYVSYLQSEKAEIEFFINLITTNETYFFRTPRIWNYFNKDFLPQWHEQNPGETLKIWSAASSSGEEAYSIGICCEDFRRQQTNFNYHIHGSDISTKMIHQAKMATYKGRSIENFQRDYRSLFEQHMKLSGETFKVSDEIIQRSHFLRHNLFDSPSEVGFFDIVFLRNVLIYFEDQDKEKVLTHICKSLKPDGILIIGEAENLGTVNCCFDYKSLLIYKKRD
jgi:chemotaxis protein methyltransferase CheR